MANDTIKKILEVEDRFSTTFDDYANGVKKTGSDSEKASPKIKKLESSFTNVAKSAKNFVLAYASMKGLQIAEDMAMASAEADSVSKSFDTMSKKVGSSSDVMMSRMREATGFMIDDMTLQQSAMKSLQAGIDPEAMITSMKYVSRYAISIGEDANQLMQTVMTGLARGSAQFLDDVGIQVMGSADVVGDAIDQMNEKMLEEPKGSLVALRKYDAKISDLKKNIGENLVPALEGWKKTQTSILEIVSRITTTEKQRVNQIKEDNNSIVKQEEKLIRQKERLENIYNESNGSEYYANAIKSQKDDIKETEKRIALLKEESKKREEGAKKRSEEEAEKKRLQEAEIERKKELEALLKKQANEREKQIAQEKRDLEYATAMAIQLEEDSLQKTLQGRLDIIEKKKQADREYLLSSKLDNETKNKALLDNDKKYSDMREREIEDEFQREKAKYDKINGLDDESTQNKLDNIEKEREARMLLVSSTINALSDVADMVSSFGKAENDRRMNEIEREEALIQSSRKSERVKQKELAKYAKEKQKLEEEAQKRASRSAMLQSATNLALITQQQILAMASVVSTTPGGPLIRMASGLAMFGALAGFVGSAVEAGASIPKREMGGSVKRGGLYEVAENGKDELLERGGKKYLLPSSDGRVIPNSSINNNSNKNTTVIFNISGGDSTSIVSSVVSALEIADRQGTVDWSGMKNLQKSIGA